MKTIKEYLELRKLELYCRGLETKKGLVNKLEEISYGKNPLSNEAREIIQDLVQNSLLDIEKLLRSIKNQLNLK